MMVRWTPCAKAARSPTPRLAASPAFTSRSSKHLVADADLADVANGASVASRLMRSGVRYGRNSGFVASWSARILAYRCVRNEWRPVSASRTSGQREQALDEELARRRPLAAGAVGALALEPEIGQRHHRQLRRDGDHRKERRDEHAGRAEQPHAGDPQPGGADGAAQQAGDDARRGKQERDGDADDQHRRPHLAEPCRRGARDEIALQEVVGHGRLHFDAGEQGIERRRDHLTRAERVGADETICRASASDGVRPFITSAADT